MGCFNKHFGNFLVIRFYKTVFFALFKSFSKVSEVRRTCGDRKSCLKMFSSPGGGRGGKEEGGSIERCGGRKSLPVGEEGKMGGEVGEVGEVEEGEEALGEVGPCCSLLFTGVFELSSESMQKLEESLRSLVLNSLRSSMSVRLVTSCGGVARPTGGRCGSITTR